MPNVSKTLAHVAEYLREHGWTQGGSAYPDQRCCCMVSAMCRVLSPDEFRVAIVPLTKNLERWKVSDMPLSAVQAEARAICWNDAQGRTFREVESALYGTRYVVAEPAQALVFDGVDYRPSPRADG